MAGGALYIRRFMMRQYLAVADQLPFGTLMLRLHRSLGSNGLIAPEEAEFCRKSQELDPSSSNVVFSTKAPRNVVRAVGCAAWNVAVSTVLSPVVALAIFPQQIFHRGFVKGVIPGIAMAGVWGCAFLVLGYTSAVHQLLIGSYHQLVAPYHYLISCKQWNPYTCRFEGPRSSGDWPGLEAELPSATIREYAMRRVARSKSDRQKENTKYQSPNKTKASESRSLYDVLGVSSTATDKEIKEAYNKLAMKLHPDRNPNKDAHEQFDNVTKAYRTLSNAEKRKKYDIAGSDGVEDLGQKKRDGVRGLFGGDLLQPLIGDVRTGSFSLRVIDGLDYTRDELGIVTIRMLQTSRDTLLSYLEGFSSTKDAVKDSRGDAKTSSVVSTAAGKTSSQTPSWNNSVRSRVHKFVNTGLAKECLYTIGQEYLRVCEHFEKNSIERLVHAWTAVYPHRAHVRLLQAKVLSKARPAMLKDTANMVDLAWYLSLSELEYTARFASWSLLNDPTVDAAEIQRRLEGIKQLGHFFIASGKEYSGANKHTVDQLMESLRSYQQSKSRDNASSS